MTNILAYKTLSQKQENIDIAVTVSEFTEGDDPRGIMLTSLDKDHHHIPMVEAVLASAAAPIFFSPRVISICDIDRCFMDGGLVANNPSM